MYIQYNGKLKNFSIKHYSFSLHLQFEQWRIQEEERCWMAYVAGSLDFALQEWCNHLQITN